MTQDQVEYLFTVAAVNKMIGPLTGTYDRTLLYGYDCDRRSWHVYQKDGHIHRAIYITSNRLPEVHDQNCELDAETLVPNKRLYPEACDFEFCLKLKALGIPLPFTTYGSLAPRPDGTVFFGKVF
jgi:hypothetical protein